jgi:hypothetical protein
MTKTSGVWTARRGQTNKVLFKNQRKKLRKWMHYIIAIETASVHCDEAGEAQ